MQEPLFLLVLMVMTALGVRVFLGQLHGTPFRLPRLRLPHPGLPRLPGRRRARRARHAARDGYPPEEADAVAFAAGASPFAAAPAPGTNLLQAVPTDEDDGSDEDDGTEDLPASQVDFFASEPGPDDDGPLRRPAIEPSGSVDAMPLDPGIELVPGVAGPAPQASPVYEVPASAEPDPGDIMSFFEKPSAATQLPETLRETMETVSATDLLAEARQLRTLVHRDRPERAAS